MELSGNSKWHFIDSGFQAGIYNMDFDLKLVEKCGLSGDSFLRFYRWKPYAISLGYNQSRTTGALKIDTQKCISSGVDIVQRPTGGRAVLHSEELTYSVIMKTNKPLRDTYREISLAIINGLRLIDSENTDLKNLSFAKETPDILHLIKTGMYNLCFNSQVKYEINFKGKKLIGSAQRKFGNIILQHGSVLIGNQHKNIVDYLIATKPEKDKMRIELNEKTICLNDLLKRNITYKETADALFKGFENTFGISFSSINRLAELIQKRELQHESVMN